MIRKYLRQLLCITCISAMLLSGCGSSSAPAAVPAAEESDTQEETTIENDTSKDSDETASEAETDEAPEASTEEENTLDDTASEAAEVAEEVTSGEPETATEIIAKMTTGWNLGNSLDATGASETSWGNPATTKAMIDEIAAEGFDVLRIPVTWGHRMGGAPDYTIDPAFLARVAEVVGYGLDNGMYVIIDTHHEPDTWLVPTDDKMSTVQPQFEALWTQVADYFKDYDNHLVFEGLNEARTKGSKDEWNGGTKAERDNVNILNDRFIEIVRSSGGNNATRLCLVSAYGNNPYSVALGGLNKNLDDYTGVAVHAYTPYQFTYRTGDSNEQFYWGDYLESDITDVFSSIRNNLVIAKIPVIITEYGAQNKELPGGGSNTQEVIKWLNVYLGSAKKYNIPCIWWDNGCYTSEGENFAIFDRKTLTWFSKDIADTIVGMYK